MNVGLARIIEPYDFTLKSVGRRQRELWDERVHAQLRDTYDLEENSSIFFHAGLDYRRDLIPLLERDGFSVEVPLEGLRQGEQINWYKRRKDS